MTRPHIDDAGMALLPVLAHVLTPLGWLQGTLHIPRNQSVVDFLSPGIQILKLTRVRLPGGTESIPFVALRRDSAHLIEPRIDADQIETPGSMGRTTARQVRCLLEAGEVRGTLDVLVNVRVSDFLRQQAHLLVLRDASFRPYHAATHAPEGSARSW